MAKSPPKTKTIKAEPKRPLLPPLQRPLLLEPALQPRLPHQARALTLACPRPASSARANKQANIVKLIRKYLLAGLLVLVPIGITLWVLHFFNHHARSNYPAAPDAVAPVMWDGELIPGFGIILAFVLLFVTGVVASNVFGKQFVKAWDSLVQRIPVVGAVYKSVKQLTDPVLSENGQAFSKEPCSSSFLIRVCIRLPS